MLLRERVEAMQQQLEEMLQELRESENEKDVVRNQFRKFDEEKRLVYAEVYLPDTEDAHGHQMDAQEIEKMAHGFMKSRRTTSIDVNHDNDIGYNCAMVESFIARSSDPDFMPGAWVGVVHVDNDKVWTDIKNGKITGFSFEGMGYVVEDEI